MSSGAASASARAAGVDALHPAQQPDLGQSGRGGLVGRALGQDLLVRPLGLVEIPVDQGVVGREQLRVLGLGDRRRRRP